MPAEAYRGRLRGRLRLRGRIRSRHRPRHRGRLAPVLQVRGRGQRDTAVVSQEETRVTVE